MTKTHKENYLKLGTVVVECFIRTKGTQLFCPNILSSKRFDCEQNS